MQNVSNAEGTLAAMQPAFQLHLGEGATPKTKPRNPMERGK